MSNEYFQFKQFTVRHDRCAMKVGTDGVLVGALCSEPPSDGRILDVGTGTGLIALMLAQRFPNAMIDAIDIDEQAVMQARENIAASTFANRIRVWQGDFCEATEGQYDIVVSNPPFFTEDTSCPDTRRDAARRSSSLPFAALIANASSLLTATGHLCVIIPYSAAADFIMQCAMNRLYLLRRVDIKTTPRKAPRRVVLEFGKTSRPSEHHTLTLHNADGSTSPEYHTLTHDFYLDK